MGSSFCCGVSVMEDVMAVEVVLELIKVVKEVLD
jgi:hypothetical protein